MSYWSRQFDGHQVLQVYAALRLPTLLMAYVAALAGFGIGLKVSRSVAVSTLIAVAFPGRNPSINCFQSGASYVPGLTMQLAAVYLLLDDSNGKKFRCRAWAAGAPGVFGLPLGFLLVQYSWNLLAGVSSGRSESALEWQ